MTPGAVDKLRRNLSDNLPANLSESALRVLLP